MEDPTVLLDNLNTAHKRYIKLQSLFNEFCTEILNLKKEDDRFNILIIEQSENTLTVKFLDRIIEANFLFFVDDNGRKNGCIHCQLLSPTKDNEPKLIEKFNFDGRGNAKISSNGDNDDDPYNISVRTDAITIFLNWVTISIKDNL